MDVASSWAEYEVLDTGDGEKIERWGEVIVRRPDPQVIWPWRCIEELQDTVFAHYHRSKSGGGSWEFIQKIPQSWLMRYDQMTFKVEPTGFKHLGLFPEQAVNWDWMSNLIKASNRPISVLNLFGYTGAATVACAKAGAAVCHVDASKGMVNWAKTNLALSDASAAPVRLIVDDCAKFVEREFRRGKTYDAILMDPPSYGRGPNGELWKIEDEIYTLVKSCKDILSENPLFFLINSYTTGLSSQVSANILHCVSDGAGLITSGDIGLPISNSKMLLPCGTYARWQHS